METAASPLRQRFDQLTPAQQQHILQIREELTAPPVAKSWWEHLTHTITAEDAELMRQASLECRSIEPDTTPTW